jgi:heat shock transcription factor 1
MLAEVRNMRGRQESLDSKLGTMKHENEALWRELAMLRQKHMKQQQIVNKLIHFLVTLVQPSSRAGGLPVKRRYPLMIDDTSRLNRNKRTKLAKVILLLLYLYIIIIIYNIIIMYIYLCINFAITINLL